MLKIGTTITSGDLHHFLRFFAGVIKNNKENIEKPRRINNFLGV